MDLEKARNETTRKGLGDMIIFSMAFLEDLRMLLRDFIMKINPLFQEMVA